MGQKPKSLWSLKKVFQQVCIDGQVVVVIVSAAAAVAVAGIGSLQGGRFQERILDLQHQLKICSVFKLRSSSDQSSTNFNPQPFLDQDFSFCLCVFGSRAFPLGSIPFTLTPFCLSCMENASVISPNHNQGTWKDRPQGNSNEPIELCVCD